MSSYSGAWESGSAASASSATSLPRELGAKLPDEFDERYFTHEQLGKGAFGRVARATEKATGREVAVKFIEARDDATKVKAEFSREVIRGSHPMWLRQALESKSCGIHSFDRADQPRQSHRRRRATTRSRR